MGRRKRLLVVFLLLLVSLVALTGCARSNTDRIKTTIRGFFSDFNAAEYDGCLNHILDITDENRDVMKAALATAHEAVGDVQVDGIEDINVVESSATARVTAIIGGETRTQEMTLSKVDGRWKLSWGASLPPSTPI